MKDTAATDHILTDLAEGILTLRFNRPEKKNAITLAMYTTLADALQQADKDDSVRAVLITGTDGCFTSGNDVADFLNNPPTGDSSPALRFLTAISRAEKPIIAAVNGAAVGIGVTMLLHCDLVYAGASAIFSMPFVNMGLCPEGGSSLLMPRMMGHQRASELLLLGETFSAQAAHEAGIVNAVCHDGELPKTALSKARRLAAQPPAAVRVAKSLLKNDYAETLVKTINAEGACFIELLRSPEAIAAMRTFMERSKPDFSIFS